MIVFIWLSLQCIVNIKQLLINHFWILIFTSVYSSNAIAYHHLYWLLIFSYIFFSYVVVFFPDYSLDEWQQVVAADLFSCTFIHLIPLIPVTIVISVFFMLFFYTHIHMRIHFQKKGSHRNNEGEHKKTERKDKKLVC